MKKRILAILCLVTAGMMVFTGCGTAKKLVKRIAEETKDISNVIYENAEKYTAGDGVVDAKGITDIKIDWINGECKIEFGDTDTITIKEETNEDIDDAFKLRYFAEGNSLKIQYCKPGEWQFNSLEKNLTVVIPKNMNLSKLGIDVVSANVELPEGLRVEDFTLDVVSGRVMQLGTAEYGKVKANSVSGDLSLNGRFIKDVDINTVSGSVILGIIDGESFRINFGSVSGDVTSDFEMKVTNNIYSVGDANNNIKVNTVSGDLQIERIEIK